MNCSDDELSTKIKMDLKETAKTPSKSEEPENKATLIRYKTWLENELGRVEWSSRQSNKNAISKMGNGARVTDLKTSSSKDDQKIDSSDKLGEGWAVRRKAQLEMEIKERQNLEIALSSAETVIANEPAISLAPALQPIANDCKAHYNLIKKREKLNSEIVADYWLAWTLVKSVQNHLPFDSHIEKYASKDFKSRMKKFMNSVDAVRYSKIESLPYVREQNPLDFASDRTPEPSRNFTKSK